MSFVQTSTLPPPSMHEKLTEHKKCCIQNRPLDQQSCLFRRYSFVLVSNIKGLLVSMGMEGLLCHCYINMCRVQILYCDLEKNRMPIIPSVNYSNPWYICMIGGTLIDWISLLPNESIPTKWTCRMSRALKVLNSYNDVPNRHLATSVNWTFGSFTVPLTGL